MADSSDPVPDTPPAPRLRVVVAGQMPPPVGGQNINIKRMFELLCRCERFDTCHWRFEFTRSWTEGRRAGLWKLRELFAVLWRLLQLRRAGAIDAIIFPAGGPHTVPLIRDLILLPCAALASRRLLVHFQAAGVAGFVEKIPAPLRQIVRFIYSRCASEAIVLTEYGREDPLALGMKKIHVLPNAIEDRRAAGDADRGEDDKREALTILHVGHLCPDKGTPQLIEAFARIADSYPTARLKLVGECLPPFSDAELRQLIDRLGIADRIEVAGLKTGADLDACYRSGDLLVFSTLAPYESFGLVLIEGMMWSLPLVATDWRGNREVVGSPPGGVCFEVGGDLTRSLEQALTEVLDSRQQWPAWSQSNRRRFEDEFTIDALQRNLLTILAAMT